MLCGMMCTSAVAHGFCKDADAAKQSPTLPLYQTCSTSQVWVAPLSREQVRRPQSVVEFRKAADAARAKFQISELRTTADAA